MQIIYIIFNDPGDERPRKIMSEIAEMLLNSRDKIYLNQFYLQDFVAVNPPFRRFPN